MFLIFFPIFFLSNKFYFYLELCFWFIISIAGLGKYKAPTSKHFRWQLCIKLNDEKILFIIWKMDVFPPKGILTINFINFINQNFYLEFHFHSLSVNVIVFYVHCYANCDTHITYLTIQINSFTAWIRYSCHKMVICGYWYE